MIRWITGWTGADVGLGSRSFGTISGRAWILVYRLELVEEEHNRRCTVSSSCRPLPLDVNPPTSTKNMKYPGFSIRHCRSWYEPRYNIHVASLSNNSWLVRTHLFGHTRRLLRGPFEREFRFSNDRYVSKIRFCLFRLRTLIIMKCTLEEKLWIF